MKDSDTRRSKRSGLTGAALRIVVIYALFSGFWILLSDTAVAWLFADPAQITLVSTIKGWLFVAVTSLLLYALIRRYAGQIVAASRREVAALKEQSRTFELLSAIVDNSTDAIFAKDRDGCYLLANREAARAMGKPVAAVVGLRDADILSPERAEALRANDQRVIAENRIATYEERFATIDGERLFVATKGPLRDGDGSVIGSFGISHDITESKRAEEKILRLSQLYAALSECNQAIVRCKSEAELFPLIFIIPEFVPAEVLSATTIPREEVPDTDIVPNAVFIVFPPLVENNPTELFPDTFTIPVLPLFPTAVLAVLPLPFAMIPKFLLSFTFIILLF